MRVESLIDYIVGWLNQYCDKSGLNGFVIGVSGGIDSAVTSTLCAKTGKRTLAISMPISQPKDQRNRADTHLKWLENRFNNVKCTEIELTSVLKTFKKVLPDNINDDLILANSRSRIRMIALYALASCKRMLVVGTGNKIEDFGIGFYTKHGDGGVDISPIADLVKSQVYLIGEVLGISDSIIKAIPTDGLWDDERSDESQIGATYPELEWAMEFLKSNDTKSDLDKRSQNILNIYKHHRKKNIHKMLPIPICNIPEDLM